MLLKFYHSPSSLKKKSPWYCNLLFFHFYIIFLRICEQTFRSLPIEYYSQRHFAANPMKIKIQPHEMKTSPIQTTLSPSEDCQSSFVILALSFPPNLFLLSLFYFSVSFIPIRRFSFKNLVRLASFNDLARISFLWALLSHDWSSVVLPRDFCPKDCIVLPRERIRIPWTFWICKI